MKEHQDKLRYPIGQFEYGKSYSLDETRKHIKILSKFPKELKNAIKKLKSGELEKTYRPDGWTVRQVINHLADSHMNGYTRMKLAVTENTPIIKPYEEQLWAELEDGKHGSIKTSVKLISALHNRWANFLKSLQEDDLDKGYYHPASKRTILIQEAIATYVWHSQHHLAHIMLVVDGKSKSAIGKKSEVESKTGDSEDKSKSAASAKAPKKRSITPEHREKIRAAQVARHAKKAGAPQETQVSAAADAPKRGRKPGVKAAAAKAAPVTAAADAPKRGRKPGVKAAAAKAAPVTAAADAPKRGRKPGVKAAPVAADATGKRKRRTKAEMAAALNLPVGTTPVASIIVRKRRNADAAPAKAPKVAKVAKAPKAVKVAKAPATNADGTPKKRGLSPEKMAEIRALRGTKQTIATTATAKPAKPAKAPKAVKVAKAPATNADGTPKKRGLSPERMAEIRALRGAKQTTATTATAKPAKAPKAVKVAKAPAMNADGTPKKRGLSPERMAEIRALRGTKK